MCKIKNKNSSNIYYPVLALQHNINLSDQIQPLPKQINTMCLIVFVIRKKYLKSIP